MAKAKNPHAVALGRRGGKAKTPAKLASARHAAQFAGRKPKYAPGDAVIGREAAPASFRGRRGVVLRHEGPREYTVRFDANATTEERPETVMSHWIERLRR